MITSATYAGSDNSLVFIEPDNKHVKSSNQDLLDWIDAGNTIDLYIEPLDSAKEIKIIEIRIYGNGLIEAAYSNPVEDIVTAPIEHRNRMLIRRNGKADKLASDIALTQEEKDEAKTDQKLSEYEIKILADSDKAVTNVNKLDTSIEVEAFDVSSQNWTVWIPPV